MCGQWGGERGNANMYIHTRAQIKQKKKSKPPQKKIFLGLSGRKGKERKKKNKILRVNVYLVHTPNRRSCYICTNFLHHPPPPSASLVKTNSMIFFIVIFLLLSDLFPEKRKEKKKEEKKKRKKKKGVGKVGWKVWEVFFFYSI